MVKTIIPKYKIGVCNTEGTAACVFGQYFATLSDWQS